MTEEERGKKKRPALGGTCTLYLVISRRVLNCCCTATLLGYHKSRPVLFVVLGLAEILVLLTGVIVDEKKKNIFLF